MCDLGIVKFCSMLFSSFRGHRKYLMNTVNFSKIMESGIIRMGKSLLIHLHIDTYLDFYVNG